MAIPVANFAADDTAPNTGQIVTFIDSSSNTPTSRYRDFWDGYNSTNQDPTHVFATPGTYTVILIATNADGSDAETKTNYITASDINPESFYNWYYIDDSGIGCWKIIAVDCNNLHYYANICDLVNSCLGTIPHDITKECIRTFFNTTIDTLPIGYFLRIDAQHCLEAVDITTLLQCQDIYVKVNAQDATSGYLASKFGSWTDGCVSTVVVPSGPPIHPLLQVQVIYPDSPFLCNLPALPTCDDSVVLIDMDGTIHYDCGDSQWRYRAVRHASNDIAPALISDVFRSFFFTNTVNWNGTTLLNAPTMDIFHWGDATMNGNGTYDGMIKIPKDGMYEIWMKGECVVNNWVSRVRLFLAQPAASNPKILIDSKRWPEKAFIGSYQCFPYQSNAWADGIEETTITLNWQTLVWLKAWQYIAMWCKIDTRYTNWVTPIATWRHTVYELYDVGPWGSSTEVPYHGPGLSFWVKRYSSYTN